MNFPLNFNFKLIALANQISVYDHAEQELMYIKQKMFKLKENIEIYQDSSKTTLLYTIKADRVIDFSPEYTLADANGNELGMIKRNGGRSLWKANYDLSIGGQPVAHIKELNPWAKVGDALFSEIPIAGMLAGFLFHPKYSVIDTQEQEIGVIAKQPAFFEGKYTLDDSGIGQLQDKAQTEVVALLMMVLLMERTRG